MPDPTAPRRARFACRLACLAAALLIAQAPAQDAAPPPDQPPVQSPDQTADQTADQASDQTQDRPAAAEQPPAEPPPVPRRADPFEPIPLGADDPDAKALLAFTPLSAGVASLSLPDDYNTQGQLERVVLQSETVINGFAAIPFAVLGVSIDGVFVSLSGAGGDRPIWSQTAPGVFVAHIDDPDGSPLLRVTRRYELRNQDRYGFTVETTLENISGRAVDARLVQTGPIDLPEADNNYAGDKRRFRYGYMLPPERQLNDPTVLVDDALANRTALLGRRVAVNGGIKVYPNQFAVWPNTRSQERGHRLAWLGFTDRYFAVIVHPLFQPGSVAQPEDKLLTGLGMIDRLVLNPGDPAPDTVMVMRFNGERTRIEPGSSQTTRYAVYAGPMSRPTMRQDALLASLRIPEVVVYNLGGWCAPCTFAWLTDALMGVLRLFHAVTGDWAIAIMLLVVLVRGILHPVTRWSQIRMQKFGAQMQAMAPKQAKLKEKYKDDPKKLQQEMAKLWKEEGINPAGMLGCLPMFLQSPVWIALYATLFFAIELRHEAAFYGVFQTISAGKWQFLADLSQPDHAIPLPEFMHFSFPLWGAVQSVNVLPLLLGVVFYVHQKFLTPPSSATLTPEQEQQQKIIKVMMVVMFPLMMYAAPSGLALYFITNSVLGIGEHKWIRAHMDKHGMLDPEKIRAERESKGPGFMARLSEAAEAQKRLREQAHGGRPPTAPSKKRKKK